MDKVVGLGKQKIWKIKRSYAIPLPPWWVRDKISGDRLEVEIELLQDGNLLVKPVEIG